MQHRGSDLPTHTWVVEHDGPVATLRYHRPLSRHAIVREMRGAIPDVLRWLSRDDDVAAVVLRVCAAARTVDGTAVRPPRAEVAEARYPTESFGAADHTEGVRAVWEERRPRSDAG